MKSFKDLIKEVHEIGICQLCGGCVSFCNSLEKDVIGYTKPNSPPEYLNEDKCLECGICYAICPQTHFLDESLNKTFKFSDFSSMPLGFIDNIYSCQATDREFLNYGTDGGVVNSLIHFMLKQKLIDGAIVAKTKSPFAKEAVIAQTREDLINASGIKLDVSQQLDEVQRFHSYTTSIPIIKRFKFKKLAVVGTPCQIYTIRCMQDLGIVPSENIEFCLGLFCYENFFFDNIKVSKFEKDFKLKFENITKINIKKDLIIKLKNGKAEEKTVHIPFNKLKDYMRPACNACRDLTNVYADISFGGLGSQDKFTTVITRTDKGKKVILKAIEKGIINCKKLDDTNKGKVKDTLTEISHVKLNRYESFIEGK
ncbi:MAG: Coenzyme F420 hydrogenase/dehydrogenase, beta subunit C-terminal domain [Promethearchaeota archaeon]